MTPKVYFTSFCTSGGETIPQKLARLLLSAGMDKIDFKDKYVAIKIHFGELGNMAYLRRGIAALNAGKGVEHELIEDDDE